MTASQWPVSFLREIENETIEEGLALWALGGAGLAVKTAQALIYLDPYFGGSISPELLRLVASPIDPTQIEVADAALSTHSHDDHCEQQTLTAISQNTEALFVGPSSSVRKMRDWGIEARRTRVLEPGQSCTISDFRVTALPASAPFEEEAISYLVQAGGVSLFHGGDSHYSEIFGQIGSQWDIDIALLSLGKEIYMGVDDVVQAACDLRAKILIPMHWDLWKAYALNPWLVAEAIRQRDVPVQTEILLLGDKFVYSGA